MLRHGGMPVSVGSASMGNDLGGMLNSLRRPGYRRSAHCGLTQSETYQAGLGEALREGDGGCGLTFTEGWLLR